MGIKFGTDGWRAIMAEDFTFTNVEIVAQGVANYLKGSKLPKTDEGSDLSNNVVIGYDNRFLSDEFARRAAEVILANGFGVIMSDQAIPTPVTAFLTVQEQAIGALMFTASHNPPEYNGVKFIPHYGGPALPEITNAIEDEIKQVSLHGNVKRYSYQKAEKEGLVKRVNQFKGYFESLKQLVDQDTIASAGIKVAVDPMFGAGVGFLDKLLEEIGCEVQVIHNYRDPLFGGKMPEPSKKVLTELTALVQEQECHLGLALDGDADRFGIIDYNGTFINANQVLALVYQHLLENKKKKGAVTKTVSTTQMLNRIAKQYGEQVLETPVGFKYIGKNLMEGAILGGEESGGLSISGHIPEKDGILACLLMVEIISVTGHPLTDLLSNMEAQYGPLVNERLDIHTSEKDKRRVLDFLEDWRPSAIGGKQVVDYVTLDGLKFLCHDGSWALIRPSGTEPLFRIYGETKNWEELKALQHDIREQLNI